MAKELFISETPSHRRVAVVENGDLVEILVDSPGARGMVGNIYKGKVENVLPGMQAAFVDIGYEVNGFLPFSEITNPEYLKEASTNDDDEPEGNGKPSPPKDIQVELKTGQEILVQVIKEAFAGKGPRVTTNLSIPGHMMVLVPGSQFVGVSKKIWDKYEKRRLRKVAQQMAPGDVGVIIRTEAEGKSEAMLRKDFDTVLKHWRKVSSRASVLPAPALVYEDMEEMPVAIRDHLTSDVTKVVFDSRKLHRRFHNYLSQVIPDLASKLELYRGRQPLFDKTGIEAEIDKSLKRRVWLKSGAYIVIDHAEAMVVVDVNSGRFVGKGQHEENSLQINLEAARETAKQLRLRDIGGLIVIDFIDMQLDANKQKVYNELRKELRKDRAKVAVSPISEFGLLEMTRQRVRLSLRDTLSVECGPCHGSGRIASSDTLITKLDQWLRRFRQKSREFRLKLILHPSLAESLNGAKRDILRRFSWRYLTFLEVVSDPLQNPGEFRVVSKRRGADITSEV